MRFMMLLKADKNTEAGVLPDEKLLVAMGKYNEELIKAGVLLSGEGLQPTSKGFRLRNAGGEITVTDGPFTEAKEIIAGFWMIQVKSREEAIEWARRVPFEADGPSATPGGNGQIEVRQVSEMSDFPADYFEGGHPFDPQAAPPPAPAAPATGARKLRYLMMFKADEKTEAGVLPTREQFARMNVLMGQLAAEGKILGGDGLTPSVNGARVIFQRGQRSVIDGPFAEAKELIAGFAMVEVASKEEALDIARRGALLNGDCQSEVRQLFTAEDFGPELQAKVPEVFEAERKFREAGR